MEAEQTYNEEKSYKCETVRYPKHSRRTNVRQKAISITFKRSQVFKKSDENLV